MNRLFCLLLWNMTCAGYLINMQTEADGVGPICPVFPASDSCFPFQPRIVSHLLAGIVAACFSPAFAGIWFPFGDGSPTCVQ